MQLISNWRCMVTGKTVQTPKTKVCCLELDMSYFLGIPEGDRDADGFEFEISWFANLKRISDVVRMSDGTGH